MGYIRNTVQVYCNNPCKMGEDGQASSSRSQVLMCTVVPRELGSVRAGPNKQIHTHQQQSLGVGGGEGIEQVCVCGGGEGRGEGLYIRL